MCAAKSGAIPGPSSRTLIDTVSPGFGPPGFGPVGSMQTSTVTRTPEGLCRKAFSRRLTKTCSRRSWSAHTGPISVLQLTVTAAAASGGKHEIAASKTRGRSHQSGWRRRSPDSMAEKSSKSPTRLPMRADSVAIRFKNLALESSSHVTSEARRLLA